MAQRVPRYNKICRRCGALFGNGTAYVMGRRAFCSPACNEANPRSDQTLRIEEMGAAGMGPRAIARELGTVNFQRVSHILKRKRRELS